MASPASRRPPLLWGSGTAIRLAYLVVVPALLWWGLGHFISLPALSPPHLTPLGWGAIIGLVLVDALHAAMDWLN